MMSSDPFKLLELDRSTATDADVRRAYAAKLKLTRPEDDRAGFMALRAAFERARNEVRRRGGDGEDAQNHSPPDAYGQSSAETGREAGSAPDAQLQEYSVHNSELPQVELAQEYEGEDYGETPSAAQMEFGCRINSAHERLVELLTRGAYGAAARDILQVIDDADVAGIEEYQAMQWKVRGFLCDRTGFNLQPQVMRAPDWLTLDVLDALDQYYGWSRQPVMNGWVRQLNDWLVRVRRELALAAMPATDSKQARLAEAKADLFGAKDGERRGGEAGGEAGGGAIWLWVGAGILISQVVRFFMSAGGS
ncbi:MAG: hypothetical protein WEA77_09930 [Hyphomonas sp.]|uniref:hypothetical protein n=1 Tax=Hyphomonas sp. TaxID=87 RepID=UPI0034A061E4